MREKYESLALTDLREIAKARGIKGTSAMKKADIVEAMLAEDEKDKAAVAKQAPEEQKPAAVQKSAPRSSVAPAQGIQKSAPAAPAQGMQQTTDKADPEKNLSDLDSGETANGILEVMPDGYGFIRCANYLPGENDVYVAPSQIRRFGLKTGDIVEGNTRVKTQAEKFSALLYVKKINGYSPDVAARRRNFEDMTPIFPDERIRLETPGASVAMRIMDLISPVGKGQIGRASCRERV